MQLYSGINKIQLTNDFGDSCDMSRSPYIDNCNYPSGFTMLQYIYQDIQYVDNSQMIAANVSLQRLPLEKILHGCVSCSTATGV